MACSLHKKTREPGAMPTPAGTTPEAGDGSLQGKWCWTINSRYGHMVWGGGGGGGGGGTHSLWLIPHYAVEMLRPG